MKLVLYNDPSTKHNDWGKKREKAKNKVNKKKLNLLFLYFEVVLFECTYNVLFLPDGNLTVVVFAVNLIPST